MLEQIFNNELFDNLKEINNTSNLIKSSEEEFEVKKEQFGDLREKYKSCIDQGIERLVSFSKKFAEDFKLNSDIIKPRPTSPTGYGHLLKDYLWSGLSIGKEKSFTFQYTWVINSEVLEVTFCFGSGVFTSGTVKEETKVKCLNKLKEMGFQFLNTLEKYEDIPERLLKEEGFILSPSWLDSDGKKNKNKFNDINEYKYFLKNNLPAKTGITKYFKKADLLANPKKIEEEIYKYFSIFKPIWDELCLVNDTNETILEENDLTNQIVNVGNNIPEDIEPRDVIINIYNFIKAKGYIYSYVNLANLYLSLKTRPFLILAGISGTGKSKLVRLFADALGATRENGQFKMISVKPDWNDNTELFGYKNISDVFIPGELSLIIMEAMKIENRNKPYFVCLDEMNLARVEYYLSDYLSLMESREFKRTEIITDRLFSDGYHRSDSPYKDLYLPDNLYIVGTVNMDDTTYAFSRKVLDRTNTIEFSEVNLEDLNFNTTKSDAQSVNNEFLKTRFLNISQALSEDEEYVKAINEKVIKINDILKRGNRHFGYRVRDEIVFYMLENKISGVIEDEDIAFDFVIMQKILPTITGSDTKIKNILIGLYNICNPSGQIAETSNYIDEAEKHKVDAKYKKSAAKIIEMLRGYEDGFTSYWI